MVMLLMIKPDQKNPLDVEFESVQELKKANVVQDKTLESLKKSLSLAEVVKEANNEIVVVISKQGEKISGVEKGMTELASQTERAKSDVLWFFRHLAKDRCCMMIMVILSIGIAAVIFVLIYKKRKSKCEQYY